MAPRFLDLDPEKKNSDWQVVAEQILSLIQPLGTGCWEWCGTLDDFGRAQIGLNGKTYKVARLAWQLFRGPIPNGLWVLHHCDNPKCINYYDDLYLGTVIDNTRDRVTRHRSSSGEKHAARLREVLPRGERWSEVHPVPAHSESHGMARLTESDVRHILALKGVEPARVIATRFGLYRQYIHRIWRREIWRHVDA